MNDASPSQESAIADLVSLWQRRRVEGQAATPDELCRECPELLPELQKRILVLERMADLTGGLRDMATLATAAGSHVPSIPAHWPEIPGYEILGELGRGGMGVVYKARQTGLNRIVALKMVLAAGHAGEAELARFRMEAESIARLQHANIVQIHEVGQHDGRPFLSLEFCAGGGLDKKLNGTPLPPAEAARLIETLARAMQAAHDKGVIHRDLKPANVLLSEDGTPKITDFGLARQVEVGQGVTVSGAVMGTPSYMAPEQARGLTKHAGPAADVYGLGAILYECLTGRPPFKAATAVDTILLVLDQEAVSVRQLQPQTSVDLATICHKCLQKEPHKRYASARELAEDLAAFLNGQPIRARRIGMVEKSWRWCRRRPAQAALLVLSFVAATLLLGGGFWYSARLGAERGEKEAAETAASAARELADTRQYFALLGQVREQALQRPPAWRADCIEKLTRSAELPPADAGLAALRSELANCLGGLDVSEIGRAAAASCVSRPECFWAGDCRPIFRICGWAVVAGYRFTPSCPWSFTQTANCFVCQRTTCMIWKLSCCPRRCAC